MSIKLSELSDAMDTYTETSERLRYTREPAPVTRPRTRRSIYTGWRLEKIIVPRNIWILFANESDRGYYGGHGSRQLWVVYFHDEELAKFTRRIQAQEYIWNKVGYK